jgi:ABC-type Mn2+/Zn2+ transport system ATPase subunit
MSAFLLLVPLNSGGDLTLELGLGGALFILGANGTGKSSLVHRFFLANAGSARRMSAHRQTWFQTGAVAITGQQRQQNETNFRSWDSAPNSRWLEHGADQRAHVAVFDIVDAQNVRARGIAEAVDADNFDLARELRRLDAPMKVLNEILRLSGIPIVISLRGNQELVATKAGSEPYSVAELSDGERNVLLLAANVLTVAQGTLLLIDEPERHIHRAVSSKLLSLLFAQRQDCAFVVSTHDVMLCLDNPAAQVLLARSCSHDGSKQVRWDADLLQTAPALDDQLVGDILGARRKVLFVEGTPQSLDLPLYALLFPQASVIAKAGCRDVEQAVQGVRAAQDLHWVRAFGIVDGDGRIADDIARLRAAGIHALDVFSIESVYYDAKLMALVAKRQADLTGDDMTRMLAEAKAAGLQAISSHRKRLCDRVVEKSIRDSIVRSLPGLDTISSGLPVNVTVDVAVAVATEQSRFDVALKGDDLGALIRRYPVRETSALSDIAARLGFQGRTKYEAAVRKLLMDDADTLALAKGFFGDLAEELS